MEHGNFASSLRTTTIERKKELQQTEWQSAAEKQRLVEKAVEEFVAEHKAKMIDDLALSAITAAESGKNTASAKIVEPIENREGLYQTAREVRDYFRGEGFTADMDTYENGYNHYYGHDNQKWKEPTECGAIITISWIK